MHSDGYLGMSIPTIKHDNLSEYGRILITDRKSWRKTHTMSYTKQFTYRPTLLHKEERGEEEKEDEYL